MTKKILMLGALALVALGACRRPQYLVDDSFVGGRGTKTIYVPMTSVGNGSNNQVVLYDYQIRMCDYDENGNESNCATSTILTNVYTGQVQF